MPPPVPNNSAGPLRLFYRAESGRVLATLVRLIGDLDLAEEAMHEAFAAALESWPETGIPDKPRPWLISAARSRPSIGCGGARFDSEAQRDFALYTEARVKEAALLDEEVEDEGSQMTASV